MRKTFLLYGFMSVCFLMIGSLVFGQQNFYVNDNSTTGDVYTTAIGSNSNPGTSSLPFATINYAISQAQNGDVIWVDAGTYIENVFVDKSITFKGAKAGNNPGASLNRSDETIVRPASNDIQNGIVFNVRTTNITIDGFLIDGDNPSISGGANINGVDVNAGMGVFNQQLFVDGLTVKNNIFKNFNRFGVFLRRLNQPTVTENNLVTNNRIDNISVTAGVGMFNSAYATVTNNYITRTGNGVYFGNGSIASNLEILIANNYIEASGTNIVFGAMAASSLDVSIINNTLNPIGSTVSGEGIGIGTLTTTGSLRVINNVISNKQNGIDISSITAPGGVYINGGGVINSTGVGLFLTAENTTFSISNLTLHNNDVGIDASGIGSTFRLSFSNVLINGGTTGIRFYGTGLTLPGNTLTGVSFLNQTKDYILQTANSFNGQTIDASTVLFEGIAPTSMTLAQLFATEDKLTHRIDFNNVGYFKLKPNEVFVTPNSYAPTLHPSFGVATTAPDINRAVAAAAEGNIIHIAAGTYNGQVFINKGLTLQGEGIGNTIINPGAVSPITLPGIPPGILYSASGIGNANIKNMTINSGSPAGAGVQYYAISLQTGGEISGCEINGAGTESNNGNGIYIQKDDVDPETLSVLNNHLHHINVLSIKINVPHIVATVNNNTIDVTGSGFGMGLVAGGEPHLIDGLDFIGNKIIGITGFGVKVNCSNSNVTISNNSFEKGANEFYTTPFIQNGGTNPINASCNWFGSADAEFVRSRIQGYNVNYSPWLSDGTDNNIALGFQPVESVCNGRQNKFYVNDNSQTGDVFTTAVGNNSNNGFSTAPFATIGYALTQAQAGDTIIVDAGTYAEQVIIDKGITIRGAGQNLTSFVPPAAPLVPPPGPFTEIGMIETTQNIGDVHISDLSVNSNGGSQNIVIQSGGSVRNCKLLNGNQGVFFRVESASKTAVVENNIINALYIATNFQGAGLTASLINNAITVSNPGFSSGVFAGLDFGPLPKFTATGNSITGFEHSGFFGGSLNTLITQNSIVGTGPAIWQISGSQIQASCNWFGTSDAELLVPKFSGSVSYAPWLSNGTDNSVAVGFQSLENVCGGRQNKFYVNDNSQTGDVFTTAVGNNSNNGFSTAPFATFEYAYSIAQAGDTVYMDAGNYLMADFILDKAITVFGPNYLVSPNDANDGRLLNAGRNAEATISGAWFTISSSNISIRGLTFSPGSKSAFSLLNSASTNNDFRNFRFEKNILKTNAPGSTQLSFTGVFVSSPNMPQTSGYIITDNRFEKNDAGTGTTVHFGYLKNITVTNNSFVVTGPTPRTQNTLLLGFPGITDSIVFSNNTVDRANTVVNGPRVANAVIANNKFYNTGTSCNFANSIAESSNIEVTGNYMETNSGGVPFIGYNRSGGNLVGSSTTLRAENNIMNGTSSGSSGQLFGSFNVTVNNSVLNPTIILKGNKINYSGDLSMIESGFVRPIVLRGKIANATVENNEISLNNTAGTLLPGVALPPNPGITINSEFGSNAFIPSNTVIRIINNKIQGFKQSIIIYDGNTGGGSLNPYTGYGNLPAGAVVNIQNNSFINDSISINNGAVGQSVNANCNWHGSAAAQIVATKVSNGSVVYSTWLTNGTDSDIPATGFQPVAGSCNGTPVTVALGSTNSLTCFGANNGSIAISISGGTPAYAIAWSKDDEPYSTNEDLTNLEPGTYGVTITDANGSIVSLSDIVISEPLLLTASASGSNVSCFGGSNGTASVTAEGGTAPYSYLWSNGSTTDDISNLPAGNYTVTITDANGCTVSVNYQVTQPTFLTATATPTSTSCFNSISVVANGGTTPYTYLWSNGATTPTISSIAAGTYSVVITDAKGCSVGANATVTANEAFNPSASVVNVSCFGGANGSITVTNVNAVAPFLYSIDGGLHYQQDATFNGLAAGTYTITVKDANGCTGFVTKTITQPVQLVVSLLSVQKTCFNQSSGAISVNITGGTSGYTYGWTGPNGYTSAQKNIGGLATGNYTLTVTDSRGCTVSLGQSVAATNEILPNSTVTNVACKGETNGSISLAPSGGSGNGFSYLWNNGSTSSSILNLGAGNYSVTITDVGTGCSVARNFTITQPASLVNLSTAKTNATGCNSLGTITATGSGGTAGYQYKLDNGTYQNSGSFTGLYAGSYTVWVKDVNGCTKSGVVSITDNGSDEYEGNNSKNQAKTISVDADIFARIAIATDAADWFKFTTTSSGNYTLTLTHPSILFTFNLYAAGNNTPALTPSSSSATSKQYTLAANTTYYISVTGGLSYQCYKLNVTSFQLFTRSGQQEQSVKEASGDLFEVKVLGNPSSNYFNIAINSSSNEKMKMRIVDVSGRIIEQKELAASQVIKIGEKYISGVYFAEIIQGSNRKTVRLVKL